MSNSHTYSLSSLSGSLSPPTQHANGPWKYIHAYKRFLSMRGTGQRVVKNDFGCGPLSSFFFLFQLYEKQSKKKKRKENQSFFSFVLFFFLEQQQQQQPIMFYESAPFSITGNKKKSLLISFLFFREYYTHRKRERKDRNLSNTFRSPITSMPVI